MHLAPAASVVGIAETYFWRLYTHFPSLDDVEWLSLHIPNEMVRRELTIRSIDLLIYLFIDAERSVIEGPDGLLIEEALVRQSEPYLSLRF